MEWEVVYQDNRQTEAIRMNMGFRTEKITISYDCGTITVKSNSLGNEFVDFGRNSIRVKLFIYAFDIMQKEYDNNELSELEEKIVRIDEWADFLIPNSLPQPEIQLTPQLHIVITGSIIISLILGFLNASLTFLFVHLLLIYEVLSGMILGLGITLLVKAGNYTNFRMLKRIVILSACIIFISCQYFLYLSFRGETGLLTDSFISFMKYRAEAGLIVKGINLGTCGVISSWCIQLVIIYLSGLSQMEKGVFKTIINKVPPEVVDFVIYHCIKGKSMIQIRAELSKLGWVNVSDQNAIFDAISVIVRASEKNRL